MLLTVTDHPQFYGLEISLSNILTIGSFCSNERTVIFSKQKKKNSQHSKPGRDHIFITFTWKGCFQTETGIKICRMRADSFVFKQKIYCSVLQTEGVGESPNWSHFVAVNV